jgi:outer membrane protein
MFGKKSAIATVVMALLRSRQGTCVGKIPGATQRRIVLFEKECAEGRETWPAACWMDDFSPRGSHPFQHFICVAALSAVASSPSVSVAQAPDRATLLGVYKLAAENDARLSAARHDYQARSEAVPQARAGLLPSLSAGATLETTSLDRDEPSLERNRSGTVFQANLSQPIFRLDRWYQLKAAQASTTQTELELSAKEQQLIFDAAQAYFETLRALDSLSASRAEEAAFKKQQDQAQARLTDGVSSITDVLDAKAAFDNARANRKLAERKVDDAFEAIYRLTKSEFSSIDGISHRLPVGPPLPNDAKAWVDMAAQNNLLLQAGSYAVKAAEESNRQHKAGHIPSLDAVASYKKGDNDSFGYSNPTDFGRNGYRDDVAQSSIGIELKVPLFSGGLTRSQVRESSERLLQSSDELEDRRREVVQQVRNAHRAVNADAEQILARRETITSSAKSLKANQVGLQVGSRNTLDVLNAQRQLYSAVRDYNDSRYDYILNTLQLKRGAGSLSPSDLMTLANFLKRGYDPAKDFLPPGVDEEDLHGSPMPRRRP